MRSGKGRLKTHGKGRSNRAASGLATGAIDDGLSVIGDAELVAFIESHRWSAGFLKFLPASDVTDIRRRAFGSTLRDAIKDHLAARSAPNFARAGLNRSQKKSERAVIVHQECTQYVTSHPTEEIFAIDLARMIIQDKTLEKNGQQPYTNEASLSKLITKVFPQIADCRPGARCRAKLTSSQK